MEAALSKWPISPVGKLCVDIGASTGGFTEVLLSRGARHVIALDVGHGQLHPSLDADLRVTRCDGVNIRDVNRQWWDGVSGEAPELIVVDVSFVSLTHVFPPAVALWPEAEWIALVKPQFEVGRTQITGGIAENPDDHEHAVQAVLEHARGLGLNVRGVMASPVTGEAGNREYLCWLSPTAEEEALPWQTVTCSFLPTRRAQTRWQGQWKCASDSVLPEQPRWLLRRDIHFASME